MKTLDLYVDADGIQSVYDDDLVDVLAGAKTKRASHVEPAPDGTWSVDLSPVGGPTYGGFATRAQALAFEVGWLAEQLEGGRVEIRESA